MLYTIFIVVLNMSITSSVTIACVLLARLFLKRAPKIFSYALWAVVLFRLICPISLTSDFSLMSFFQAPIAETGQIEYLSLNTVTTNTPMITVTAPASHYSQAIVPTFEKLPNEKTLATSTIGFSASLVSAIWMCGVITMLLFNLFQLVRLHRKLIGAVPLRGNIFLVDHIPTPFVMGLLRPKIYLPSGISNAEQSYIVQHEMHHICRGDHIVKLIAFLTMCAHWFNPLVWIAFALSNKDMEMSCDEAVMKKFDGDIRADYSSSLLQFSIGKKVIMGTPLAFCEGNTRERINNVMKYKKPTFIIVASALVLCIGLTACLSTNPHTNASITNNSESTYFSVSNGEYTMSDKEFTEYISRPIGSIMANIDYADDEKIVFHYLEGFFVADMQSHNLKHKINISKLNVAPDGQGDTVLQVRVDEAGCFAYITSVGTEKENYKEYIIDLDSGEIREGSMTEDTKLFTNFADIGSITALEGWTSVRCVKNDGNLYYLLTQDGVVGGIKLVIVSESDISKTSVVEVFGDLTIKS